jgi:hypothetical protein
MTSKKHLPFNPGLQRVTADSRAGRAMAQAPGARIATPDDMLPPDIREHNRRVDEAKALKKSRKKYFHDIAEVGEEFFKEVAHGHFDKDEGNYDSRTGVASGDERGEK